MDGRRGTGETDGAVEALLIAGPTASGKSALAVRAAERLGGVVINADAMQVYADLPILSARPTVAEQAGVPHRLFGTVDGAEAFSVGRWLAATRDALAEAGGAGRLPVLVGGTGLYFKALTQGLSAIPDVPETVRAAVRAEAAGLSPAALHARLAERDPAAAARLRPSDPQRLLRALEVVAATGCSITVFQARREPPLLPAGRTLALFVLPDREASRAAIDARFDGMMARGALDEVAALARRGLDPALPVMRALGVPPLLAYLSGTLGRAEAVASACRDTRAYARRQLTFGRHQLAGFRPVAPEDAAVALDAVPLRGSWTR